MNKSLKIIHKLIIILNLQPLNSSKKNPFTAKIYSFFEEGVKEKATINNIDVLTDNYFFRCKHCFKNIKSCVKTNLSTHLKTKNHEAVWSEYEGKTANSSSYASKRKLE